MYMLQSEILREADAMAMLDHAYIVRLYGACMQYSKSLCIVCIICCLGIVVTTPIMLVMEIASLGPLNKFLRKHP